MGAGKIYTVVNTILVGYESQWGVGSHTLSAYGHQAMYRTLLKLLIYEMVEKIARFENLLDELGPGEGVPSALVNSLKLKLNELKHQILAEKPFLLLLFSDKTSKEKDFSAKLEQVVYAPYRELCHLSQLLSNCLQGNVLPETYLLLQDTLSEPFHADRSRQVILMVPEGETHAKVAQARYGLADVKGHSLLLEPLSYLSRHNPLGWVGLTRAFANQLYDQSSALESLRIQMKGPLAQEETFRALVVHCLSLRLLGPSYYYYSVTEALLTQDRVFLGLMEDALFYGLNHFNFINKSLVILHEATEKAPELFTEGSDEDSQPLEHFAKERVAEILRTVEKVIPNKCAFSDKNFHRSLQLQDRLGQEILLSSTKLYPPEEVHEGLTSRLAAPRMSGEKFPIYDYLTMVTETPNTPREIVNAGWVHKLDRAPVWLYNTINSSGLEGFDRLLDLVRRQDHLLVKSIETSEVHRVLLCGV